MSKIEVDAIVPQSGTNLTVGESGDTITIPSGATFDASNATTTLPSTVVTTTGSQTLTNKTIDASQLTGTITPSDGTVTTDKIVDANVTLAKLSATGTKDATTFLRGDNTFAEVPAGGITEADQWRRTTFITSDESPISSNLERVDDASFAKIGTGMSVSSGVWTFPTTGLYQVGFFATITCATGDTVAVWTEVTQDNGSNWDLVAYGQNGGGGITGDDGSEINLFNFVNVTDTSNVKVRFNATSISAGSRVVGVTDYNMTAFYFIRLGDSQ